MSNIDIIYLSFGRAIQGLFDHVAQQVVVLWTQIYIYGLVSWDGQKMGVKINSANHPPHK
jgi:hypothetical protein